MRGRHTATVALLALGACSLPSPAEARVHRPPVVLIVFDEFPTDSLVAADGRIDARRYPGFAALARTSTWYRNGHSVADETLRSIPAILSARRPRAQLTLTYKSLPRNAYTLFGSHGYRIRAVDKDTGLCPPRYCPHAPPYSLPPLSPVADRVDELRRVVRSLRRTRPPTFTFVHSLLPHVPWHLDPGGHLRDPGPPRTVARELASPFGFDDPFLTVQDEQRHLLQVGYVDRVVRNLIRQMRRRHIFDRSLLVITADHGISFERGVTDRRSLRRDGGNIEEIAPVPLFVKAPRQRHGRVSRSIVRGTDVVPTMAHVLRMRLNWKVDGAAASSREVRRRRTVVAGRPQDGFTLHVPLRRVERRRKANVARRHRLFGSGSWERVYRVGPNQALLGLRPGDLPAAPSGGLRAGFDLPRGLSHVSLTSRFLPTWAVGTLRGGNASRTARRDLALAVNGRIRAVGRSVHLLKNRDEFFTLIYSLRHLRRGRNRVALYEVRHFGPNLALAPLGSG